MTEANDIELLYDLWEQNIETLRALQRHLKEEPGIIPKLVAQPAVVRHRHREASRHTSTFKGRRGIERDGPTASNR
jgi:hypothetical protein